MVVESSQQIQAQVLLKQTELYQGPKQEGEAPLEERPITEE
jgi:hypothetical protein